MEQTENKIDLIRPLFFIKRYKWIYLSLIVVFIGLGIWLSVRSLPNSTIEGSMLIGEIGYDSENKGAGGIAQMMKTFSVGGFGGSTVDNEIQILKSHDVMMRTVRSLGLTRVYIGKDSEGEKAQLYQNSPVRIEAPVEFFDSLTTTFKVKIDLHADGTADIKATKGFFGSTIAEMENASLPKLLETPYGSLQVMPTDCYATSAYRSVTVTIKSTATAATDLNNIADIECPDKMADVINVDLKYSNTNYGKAIVNGIMGEYNAKRLDRLHEASVASIKYYDERIAETFKELEKAEQAVAEYQRTNSLMGIDSETSILVETSHANKAGIVRANNEITYFEMVLRTLRERLNDDVIIPQMESLSDPNISTFNGLIAERRELRRSATDDNQALLLLNEKIANLRNLIIENSEKMIAKAKRDVEFQKSLVNTADSRLDKYPKYELEFKNLLRDKEYQNALYQYLVQSRENSVLQLYSTTNVGFVFQDAYVKEGPSLLSYLIKPLIMFVLALICCGGIIIYLLIFKRKVKEPADLSFIYNHTLSYSGNPHQIDDLRTLVMAHPERKVLYMANFTEREGLAGKLAESIMATGRSVELIENATDNDTLLSPAMGAQIEEALNHGADYVMVTVPETGRLRELEHQIDATDADLVVWLPMGGITRAAVKKALKGQTADRVYAVIVK